MKLDGARVLLTGATGGLGQAIARALAARGAAPVLTGRRADVLEPLAAETIVSANVGCIQHRDEVERLAAECADVDVLVANAALPASGDIFSFSVEEIDRALDVNLRAPIMLARRLGERMADANDEQRAALEKQMRQLQEKMAPLQQQMQQAAQQMAAQHAKLDINREPMASLHRQMAEASKPMQELGRKMGELGREQALLSREADKTVRNLIDDAITSGRAKPVL